MTQSSAEILSLCDQALALESADRDAFLSAACKGNTVLRAQVDSVLIAIDGSEAFLAPASERAVESLIGQQIGQWQVTELLGEGGMGSVYRAQRSDDIDHTVAIKLVHAHLGSRELIRRFEAERQMLARLHHPYIAALLDGGTTHSGLPYLVMEHIEGQPVDAYCDDRRASVHDRIRLLIKICTAVQAAHQNLIVHRDLKPNNVLVTADGIPKLLDFGIAKLLDADGGDASLGHTTVFGRQALTPDYASPEQILTNNVTTVSDIYSLGVLAYQLLSGERPYHLDGGTQQGLVAAVETLSVPRPSTRLSKIRSDELREELAAARGTTTGRLVRTLEGDLDKILLKALHREPSRRYQSVAELKADFANYLDGLPVSAQSDSAFYRASRFISRNKFAVGGAALFVLSLIGGLGSTWLAYQDAQAARGDASARYAELRSLTNSLMFDVQDDIARIPGTVSAQKKLLGITQTYLASLATDSNAPLDVQLDAASGYARLFSLLQSPAVASGADTGAAEHAREQANALFARLTEDYPAEQRVWLAQGRFLGTLATESLYANNNPQESRSQLTRAQAALERYTSLAGPTTDALVELTRLQIYRADTHKWETDYAGARPIIYDALDRVERLLQSSPGSEPVLRVAGEAYLFAGQLSWFLDEFDVGIEHYTEALRHFDAVAARYPGELSPVADARIDTLWSTANTHIDSGRPVPAQVLYREAIDELRLRIARDPDDQELARRYAILRGSLSVALVRGGKAEEAIAQMQEVNAWFVGQAQAAPDSPSAQRSLAVSYHMLANIYDDAGDDANYCAWLAKTRAQWARIDQSMGLSDFDADQPAIIRELEAEYCQEAP